MPKFEDSSKKAEFSDKYTLPDGTKVSKEAEVRINKQRQEMISGKDKEYNSFSSKLDQDINFLEERSKKEVQKEMKEIIKSEINKLNSAKRLLLLFKSSKENDFTSYIDKYIKNWKQELTANTAPIREASIKENLQAGEDAREFIQSHQEQFWASNKLEKEHEKLMDTFRKWKEKGGDELVRKMILDFFEPIIMSNIDFKFEPAMMSSLNADIVKCRSASMIAGKDINRVAINISDSTQYRVFMSAVFGKGLGPFTGAIFIPGNNLQGTIFEATGLMITNHGHKGTTESNQGHEIRHSIDPFINKRQNYDMIIGEALAYYFECFKEGWLIQKGQEWEQYLISLSRNNYYQAYSSDAENKISEGQFKELCQIVVDGIKKYRQDHNDIETQRMLATSANLKIFFQNIKEPFPKILK